MRRYARFRSFMAAGALLWAFGAASSPRIRLSCPSQGLEARIGPSGYVLRPAGGGWAWGLRLSAAGRPGRMEPVRKAGAVRRGDRAVFSRGPLEEWYEPRPDGIEQGFRILERPGGHGPLVLEQELGGDLVALESRRDGIRFGKHGRTRMSYRDLRAEDARGRPLPARMRLEGRRLSLEVEDEGVDYPVSIDPLATAAGWAAEASQASESFGTSAGSAGDVNGDGYSDLLVAAPLYDNGESDEGRVYVFHGGSGGLSTAAAWTVESDQASAFLGHSAASLGDLDADGYSDVVVGAYAYDNGEADEGRVWVYRGSSAGLSTTAAWTGESNQISAQYGFSVASAGDVSSDGFSDLAVGARLYDNGASDEGRVYVYHGWAGGLLSAAPEFTAESNQAGATFGHSVASAGDVNGDGYGDLAVGSPLYDNGEGDEGRAWLYHGTHGYLVGGLNTTVAWTYEISTAAKQSGNAVAPGGDVNGDGFSDLLVGSFLADSGGADAEEGWALLFLGSGSGLSTAVAWTGEDDDKTGMYGIAVHGLGDVDGDGFDDVVVGAPRHDNGSTDEGRIWVYHGGPSGPPGTASAADWTTELNQTSAFAGLYASKAGDVDGDGFTDLVLAAPRFDNGQTDEGRARVHHGGSGTVAFNTYGLPGKRLGSDPDPCDAHNETPFPTRSHNRRVARDSNGFWYVVWGTLPSMVSGGDVLLAYTTTSTPTASTDWLTVTLVDKGATGVIQKSSANDADGRNPSLALQGDVLHLGWFVSDAAVGTGIFWSKCTNLSALTSDSSWSNPVGTSGYANYDMAVDGDGIPHLITSDGSLRYRKYNSGSASFGDSQILSSNIGVPRIAVDTNNVVYILFENTVTHQDLYLLASTNAYWTNGNLSTWMNLGQTTTVPDTVNSSATTLDAFSSPELCLDYNGICHVVWRTSQRNGGGSALVAAEGFVNQGFLTLNTIAGGVQGAWKRPLSMTAFGNGDSYLFSIAHGGRNRDAVYATKYTAPTLYGGLGTWGTPTATSGIAAGRAQGIWSEHRAPSTAEETVWFLANDAQHRIDASWTDRRAGSPGWLPPKSGGATHPHYVFAFPATPAAIGSQGVPVVAQTSKSAVYVAEASGSGRIFALDRTAGTVARSYTLALDAVPVSVTAATYLGNVHLFAQQNANSVLKLIDDGTTLALDPAWVNNPRILGSNVTKMLPPLFLQEAGGGVRYLYTLGDGTGTGGGLFKLKADNGVLMASFPFGEGAYQANYAEPQLRVLNDQVFAAGLATQLLRRETDGSAQIASSAIANLVRHLVQVRGADNNRFFVAPEDKAVWLLSSGLKTTDWTSGTSANFGAVKTSGGYYTRYRNAVLVGVGNQLYRLNVTDGSIWANWPMATTGNIVTLPVEWRTFVYFGTDSGRLYAVNATSNVARANWPVLLHTGSGAPVVSSLAFDAVSGHIYFATGEGRIYKLVTE